MPNENMPNENIFQKIVPGIKKAAKNFESSFRQELALSLAAPLPYLGQGFLAVYGTVNGWYNRARKTTTTLNDLKLLPEFTEWVSNLATSFIETLIQIFDSKYETGKLAKKVKEAAEKSKEKEGIEKDKWESAVKTSPLALFFKFWNSLGDLIDSVMLFMKTLIKVNEINARIELHSVQELLSPEKIAAIQNRAEGTKGLVEAYKKAYKKVIQTARDPFLAMAFLNAYQITFKKLEGHVSPKEITEEFSETITKYKEAIIKAEHAQAIAFHDLNLNGLKEIHEKFLKEIRDLNPKVTIVERDLPTNCLFEIHPGGEYLLERDLDTDYNKIKNLVETKEGARVSEYTLEILKRNPLFSTEDTEDTKNVKKLFPKGIQDEYQKYEKEKNTLKENIKRLQSMNENSEDEKKELEKDKQKLAYLKQKNQKILPLCDLSKVSNLANADAKLSKVITLASAVALIINASVALIRFVLDVVILAKTGDTTPVIKSATNLVDTITNFAGEKTVTFIDVASKNTFGWFWTWKKAQNAKNHYLSERAGLGQELILRGKGFDLQIIEERKEALKKAKTDYEKARKNYEEAVEKDPITLNEKREDLFNKRELYHTAVGKNDGQDLLNEKPAENKFLIKLKNLRVLKTRFEHEKLKTIKKSIATLGSVFMFSASVISFFLPATAPLVIAAGIIAFIATPIIRRLTYLGTPDGLKEIREEAVELKLLPKDAEDFKSKGFSLWLYVVFSFLFKATIESVIKDVAIFVMKLTKGGMEVINWIIKKTASNNPENQNINEDGNNQPVNQIGILDALKGMDDDAIEKKAKKVLAFSYLIAKEIQAEAQKLNLVAEDGSVNKNKKFLLFIYAPISFVFKIVQFFIIKLPIIGLMNLFRRNENSITAVDNVFSHSIPYAVGYYLIKKIADWLTEPRGQTILNAEDMVVNSYINITKHVYLLKVENLDFPINFELIRQGNQWIYPDSLKISGDPVQLLNAHGKKGSTDFNLKNEGGDSIRVIIKLKELKIDSSGKNDHRYSGFFEVKIKNKELGLNDKKEIKFEGDSGPGLVSFANY